MMNTIWNNEELKKVRFYLKKFNLKINGENNLVKTDCNYSGRPYLNEEEEVKKLFYYQDKENIYNVLSLVNPIKEMINNDPDNSLYFGFITTLSKIDTKDISSIFVIFHEIISEYLRVCIKIVNNITNTLLEPELIKEKIKEIENGNSKEELYIRNYINTKFSYTNGITDNELFKQTVSNLDSNIANILIDKLKSKARTLSGIENRKRTNDLNDFFIKNKIKRLKKWG